MAPDNQVKFQGFQFPTTTPVPDEVFDVLMPHLSGAELKVLLYICRRTFGFKKESDTISLHQIAAGIKTRDGRVLDGGTGLCKRHVQRALKALEKKNIIQVTRKVDETGLNDVNTYSLNMLDTENGVGTKCPYGRDKMSPGVETPASGGVGTPVSTTRNSNQETVIQETDIVVDVAQDLENFGIAKAAAIKLKQDRTAEYIREKLEMAKGLAAAGSRLVSQNPAGWLRRAIEEDYTLPKTSERYRQGSGREKKHARRAQAELRATSDVAGEQHMAKEQPQQAQNVPTEMKEPVETDGENQATWDKALEQLKIDLPQEEVAARFAGTILIEVTNTAARIRVPNPNALAWLERRLYGQIVKAIKGVVGKELDLQFIAAS
jgi:phage replication O-like protein O